MTRCFLPALLVLLSACAHPTAPTPLAPTALPQYHVEGNSGDLCVADASFYRAWMLTIHDAGATPLRVRAVLRHEPAAATCDAPPAPAQYQDVAPVARVDVIPVGGSGRAHYILDAHTCGRAQYELWLNLTRVAVTRAASGRAC